jgi:hypothetical protein
MGEGGFKKVMKNNWKIYMLAIITFKMGWNYE